MMIDSSTGSPVHVLMLSIQAVRGLPRLRAPGIVKSPQQSGVIPTCLSSSLASCQKPLRPVVPTSPNPGSTTRPQPTIDHYDAVSTFHDDDFCETRLPMLCIPAVWNSLPKTVFSSDYVTVFMLSLLLCSLTHYLAPLKLRHYGAIQILILLLLIFKTLSTKFTRIKY